VGVVEEILLSESVGLACRIPRVHAQAGLGLGGGTRVFGRPWRVGWVCGECGVRIGIVGRRGMMWSPAQQLGSVVEGGDLFALELQFLELFSEGLEVGTEGFNALFRLLLLRRIEFGFGEVGVGIESPGEGGE
jgi:hypothetical protein